MHDFLSMFDCVRHSFCYGSVLLVPLHRAPLSSPNVSMLLEYYFKLVLRVQPDAHAGFMESMPPQTANQSIISIVQEMLCMRRSMKP